MTVERYERGWEKLMEVDGTGGAKVIESLKTSLPIWGNSLSSLPLAIFTPAKGWICGSASLSRSPRSPLWAAASHSLTFTSMPRLM
ncbi:hypothetical protein PATY110618_27965 [Paenibacillus typhae]|uniref:Uncharacterized protein n=1 Tax=Paenibacillus typhae TaxID=1174501 RepID=A0A1G9D288_9BACL|nr:hypothetical protein SAMN05216192_14622 [Paenibacillus typhae]